MITRRSFIIGAASALTLSLVDKFINYADKHGEPIILAPKRPGDILYAFPSRDFQLGLNGDPWKLDNPDMTWRQFLVELFNYPNPVKLSQFKEIECDWGIKPTMLDEPVPSEHLWEAFEQRGPHADAHELLDSLDIGPDLDIGGEVVGGLTFYDGPFPGNNYLGVHAECEISLSLLQYRLNELGSGVAIKVVV